MTRCIRHDIRDGYIDVTGRAYSLAEALAMDAAIKALPVPAAYIVAHQPPELPTLPDGHPTELDEDAGPVPMALDEAVAR